MKLLVISLAFVIALCEAKRGGGGGRRPPGGGRPRPRPPRPTDPTASPPQLSVYSGACFARVKQNGDEAQIVLKFNQPIESLNVDNFVITESKRNKVFFLSSSDAITTDSVEILYSAEYIQRRRTIRARCGCNRGIRTTTVGPLPEATTMPPTSTTSEATQETTTTFVNPPIA